MSAAAIGAIAYQLIVFSVVGFAAGELLLRWAGLMPRRQPGEPGAGSVHIVWAGITERMLSAIVGFVAVAVGLMALQIITQGFVFGTPGVVPVLALVVVAAWWRGRLPLPRPRPISYVKLGALIVVLLAIFATPAFVSGSSVRTGDPPWHLGWTEQLLAGEPVPVGPAPEFGANAYPWGLHSTMATMVRLAPGTDPLTALETLHLILIAGLPIAAACLAFRLRKDAGWAAAAAMALIGGFGWVTSGGADFVTSPGSARYGADMVVASPNSVYEMLPPALPRELGVVLLGAAALFTLIGARNNQRRSELLAGFTAGLAGLVSVPMFVSALMWMIVASVVLRRPRFARHTVGGAGLVFGLWGIPVLIDYVRYSGFVNITPRLGVEWNLLTSLGAWGLLLPLAVIGVVLAARRAELEDRLMLAFGIGTVTVLALSILRGVFDWNLAGNATLLHQGRVWPPLHLLGAAFAGAGLMWIYSKLQPKAVAAGVVVGILGVGAISPVLSAIHLTDVMERGAAGFIYASDDIQGDSSFVRRAAEHLGPDDIVLVAGDPVAFHLFEFSGARLAYYDHPNLAKNDLRIRFADLAARWQEKVDEGGFKPTYIAAPALARFGGTEGLEIVAKGTYQGEPWALFRTSPSD